MTGAHRVALLREWTRRVGYRLWVERGRPFGSPEVDWFQAEVLLNHLRSTWILEGSDPQGSTPESRTIASSEPFGLSQD